MVTMGYPERSINSAVGRYRTGAQGYSRDDVGSPSNGPRLTHRSSGHNVRAMKAFLNVAASLAVTVLFLPPAFAQTVNQREPEKAQKPVGQGNVVLSEHEGTVVWRSSDDPAFTLWTLANYVAPILWFSPDEPLLRAGVHLPQSLPPLTGTTAVGAPSRVYYDIPMVVIRNEPRCAPLVAALDPTNNPISNENLAWNDDPAAAVTSDYPPLECLESVKIRFFFYYASELGVHAHLNDFESLQVNVSILRNDASDKSGPFSFGGAGVCANEGESKHCAVVTGLFGSAHGIAWYTNGLNVDRNRDTLLPASVLVEEGKHASSPDRNADGLYTPGFDVDIHPNDAWGIRDTLRTRWLQGPAFRADMSKHRLDRDRIFPPVPNWRLAETWVVRTVPGAEKDSAKAANDVWQQTYELLNIRAATAMAEGVQVQYCSATSDQLSADILSTAGCDNSGRCEELRNLFRGEEGCRRTRVLQDRGWLRIRRTLARLNVGGSHDEYLTWPRFFAERVAPSLRLSGSARSVVWTPPIALNIPGLDGWLSARLNVSQTSGDHPSEGFVDGVYSQSAARYFSFYTAIGADAVPDTDSNDVRAWHVALEGGFKWRFTVPVINLFAGARIGIRAVDPTRFRYPRLIFEIGGGSW